MLDNKPQIDTTWNLKWKTSTEDWLVKLLYLIRTQRETTQEQQHALRNWNSDSADWVKHRMSFPLKAESDIQTSDIQPINTD